MLEAIQKAKDFLRTRGQAYRLVFKGVHAETVMTDLAKFCRANESTFHKDPRVEGIMQGRREVWLRIAVHLNLTEDQLWHYFNPRQE
tara:strand:+ start:536 stop:796 length:261 start_codon:yes stop_codon:yes gene_type:complete